MKLKLFNTAIVLPVLFFLMFMLFLAPPRAFAAEKKGIQLSPLTFDFKVLGSEIQSGTITVTNLNNEPLSYILEVENFADVNEEGAPSFAGKEIEGSITTLADWFTFDAPKEGVLLPRKSNAINFTIDIPAGADPGGHYAAVFAREIKKNAEGKIELGIASRVGALILVSVPGEVTKSVVITDFLFPKFVWKGPVDFSMKIKNTGSVHFDSAGSFKLKSILGKTSSVGVGSHTVIPRANGRAYSGAWAKKYPFGYYNVTASATDGNGKDISLAAGTLIAIPLIIVIPAFIGIILLILLIVFLRKHLRFKA